MDKADFTLVIPTFKRPRRLCRLLRFLDRTDFKGRIIVADSSPAPMRDENSQIVRACRCPPRLIQFPPDTAPFDKFAAAAGQIDTPFGALCADDDLVLPRSLDVLLDALRADTDVVAAHGWYFSFQLDTDFHLLRMVYTSPSLAATAPLDRLQALLSRYESLTYAVYRTPVLQASLNAVRPMRSLLLRELGSGGIAVLKGKVARVPVLYYGRAIDESESYANWHPLDCLLRSPEGFLADYAEYRQIVLSQPGIDDARLVDLLHLRYFCDYITPDIVDRIIAHSRKGSDPAVAMSDIIGLLPRPEGRLAALFRKSGLFQTTRRLIGASWRKKLAPLRHGGARARTREGVTASGTRRTYRLHSPFLKEIKGLPQTESILDGLLNQLSAFE